MLRSPDARLQLVVTGRLSTGDLRDQTERVNYAATPAGVVSVDVHGFVTPLADGQATITATSPKQLAASISIHVEQFNNAPPVNFPNQIVPIFTKLGCNSGGCHGKSGGQNGFRLSLLGFDPPKDYRYLVNESRGRRLFPADPDQSLLLLKSTNILAHGGGERLKKDTREYRLLARWIAQGMPFGRETDPVLAAVSVYPPSRTVTGDARQQLLAVAHYSDGSTEDITQTAQYEPNDKDMAEISGTGQVKMLGRPGGVAVMVRYQGQVCVFRATVPVGAAVANLPSPKNFIDTLAFERFTELGLPPSEVCDDPTFLRRVTLDLTGRLPTADEARAFLSDTDSAKRETCIDRLLASDGYADYFTEKWSAILRNRRDKETYQRGNYLFHEWVRDSIATNKPYDRFVRELLTASGDVTTTPAVSWYRQVDDPGKQVEDTAQLFLGVRIGCAKCHHHPFEKWGQQDYYGMSAFFSRLGRKEGSGPDEFRVFHQRGVAQAQNPATGKSMKPAGLGAKPLELGEDDDPRNSLADWLTAKDNPFFSRALANRYWKHFFGRGLVDPEDDMRETNPASNPKLLEALARHFADGGYDMRELVRTICQSKLYQLSASPNTANAADRQSYSHFYPRRLPAEVMLDAIDQLDGTTTSIEGVVAGGRAVQMPDLGSQQSPYFLQVFGRPAGGSACECERTGDTSLAQTLHLLNSNDIYDKLGAGCAKRLSSNEDTRADEQKLTDLYYAAYSRPPTEAEMKRAIGYIREKGMPKADPKSPGQKPSPDQIRAARLGAYEDVLWAIINSKEFLFNH